MGFAVAFGNGPERTKVNDVMCEMLNGMGKQGAFQHSVSVLSRMKMGAVADGLQQSEPDKTNE
jgi:hypothetical protein